MQACLENTALPLLDSVPAWTIRVARPAATDRNELARELHDVPKAALRQVFGKTLGTRLWQHQRAADTANAINAKRVTTEASSSSALISDGEISRGMLRYLCTEAAATLRNRNRLAKSIALTVQYRNGESEALREPLPHPTNEVAALEATALLALRSMRSDAFVSLKLDLTATPARA
jgi:nucleotidyltransferase/DNA polymerase involved in DNA repair